MAGSSTQLVIVALPTANDYVRKISSEKEPHLTLLYLGEPDYDGTQLMRLGEYVQYASTFLPQFTLDVERRGVLGDKNADVLFFNKRWTEDITRFREQLLQDPLISAAYNAEDQYEGWTPHLTLGYPETPAKKDPNGYDGDVTFTKFDRIAMWIGDYEGPTFDLKPYSYEEVAMSQIKSPSSDVLRHYGVKGMKWGHRKSESGGGKVPRKIAKADAKFEKNAVSTKTWIEVHNRAAAYANTHDIDRINNKPKYKNADFSKPSKLRDAYYKEHEDAFNKALDVAAKSLGTNASGTRQYTVKVDKNGAWGVTTEEVKHEDAPPFRVVPEYDETGHILSLKIEEVELKHYGVKGMKWGVRKADSSGGGSTTARAKPPSADYKNAAASQRKIDTGGTHTLSNQELQGLINRMNLEKQYHSMTAQSHSEMDRGLEGVKKALKVGKTIEDVRKFMNTPTGKAIKTGLKVAATAGAAYATGGTSAAAKAGGVVVVRRAANHYTNVGR